MQIYTLDPLHDPRWTEFVRRSPRASVFHTHEWLDAIHRTYGYQPVVFTTSPPARELRNGLVFCRIRSWLTGNRMVSLPFSDHCEPLVDSIEELDVLLRNLRAGVERRDRTYLELRPVTVPFEEMEHKEGFSAAGRYYLHRLDLRPSLNEIFHGLHKDSVRRRIARAEKAGIAFKTGRSAGLLRDFFNLLILTRRRHHLPPQPYLWFSNLAACMGESLQIRAAYKDTSPLAAVLTLRFRDKTYYKYGCSDARFHNLGAMSALLWQTVEESKAAGSVELDLGRSESQNKGLLTFKNRWAPDPSPLVYWRYPASAPLSLAEGWKLRIVKRLFSCMPNRLLSATGRLIYRHIG